MIDRINDLLDEAELIKISKKRHSLGIPQISTELRLRWLKTKSWYRKTLRKRKFGRLLRLSNETISYIAGFPGKEIQNLMTPLLDWHSYRPPLVDIQPYLSRNFPRKRSEELTRVATLVPWLRKDLREYVQVMDPKKRDWLLSSPHP